MRIRAAGGGNFKVHRVEGGGVRIVSGSLDETVRVWDPSIKDAKKACVQTLLAAKASIDQANSGTLANTR